MENKRNLDSLIEKGLSLCPPGADLSYDELMELNLNYEHFDLIDASFFVGFALGHTLKGVKKNEVSNKNKKSTRI